LSAVIFSNDGEILAIVQPEYFDLDATEQCTRKVIKKKQLAMDRLRMGRLNAATLLTADGYYQVHDFGGGILVALHGKTLLSGPISISRCD